MARFAAIVVFAGAVVLSTQILAPAAPTPAMPALRIADLRADLDQTAPIVDEMNAQVDKLRKRLAAPPAFPAPTRDPFRFGSAREPSRSKPTAPPAPIAPALPPAPPVPTLPRLVAITSSVVDGATVRTAVLSAGDDLRMMKTGDVVSHLVIRSISADLVELADPVSGAVFRISLQ